MTLEQFAAEARNDIERFETWWKKKRTETPEFWPGEMEPGDWFDQFLQFVTLDEDTAQ